MFGYTKIGSKMGAAAPGANTNIFSTSLTPNQDGLWSLRIHVTTTTIVDLVEDDGTTTNVDAINDGVALVASQAYTFDLVVEKGKTYNFRFRTNGVVKRLLVLESLVGK